MQKKAQAYVWLVVLVTLFGMALLYLVINESIEKIKPLVVGNFTGTRYEATYNKINTIWDMWLLIALAITLIWGILAALRRNDYNVY